MCFECKQPIRTQSFLAKGDDIYCAPCHDKKFAKKCFHCKQVGPAFYHFMLLVENCYLVVSRMRRVDFPSLFDTPVMFCNPVDARLITGSDILKIQIISIHSACILYNDRWLI
ncbi:Four and a half LIM domains protein 1 [Liparis tanakae]|uniref:Four and a half LIM domains protein 1 n=1 Tax=Liparis tanakae TaxID=230148 RepID=A0A4Z2E8T2_9TELE|nr:Four and a half LIM domains protein 1 [Liparis tanakae]